MVKRNSSRNTKTSLINHFPSQSKVSYENLYLHMFTEDIHQAIMPIGGRTNKQKDFAIKLNGSEADCINAEDIIGALGKFNRFDITASVCDMVGNIAMHLSFEGQAAFEIMNSEENINFERFTTKNLFQFSSWYFQLVPLRDWSVLKRKFTIIHKNKIWKINMPHKLGGTSGHKLVLKKLQRYNQMMPDFYRRDLDLGTTLKYFDFSQHTINKEIYLNRATHAWGWNRRDFSQEKSSEFYSLYKMLSFKYAQAILREHIIAEINYLLVRLSIRCQLIVSGIPTADEILKIRDEMQNGKISFTTALDKTAW